MIKDIVVGTSEPQDFALTERGAPLVGTGFTVSLEIVANEGSTLPEDLPTVAWLDQAAGTVRVTGVEALGVGGYRVRFKLTDVGSNIGFSPNGEKADLWRVVAVGA